MKERKERETWLIEQLKKNNDIICGEDGFWFFWPTDFEKGGFTPYELRVIADALDEMNEAWEQDIKEYFLKESQNGKSEVS